MALTHSFCCNWVLPLELLKLINRLQLPQLDSCNWVLPLAVLKPKANVDASNVAELQLGITACGIETWNREMHEQRQQKLQLGITACGIETTGYSALISRTIGVATGYYRLRY